MRVWAMLAIAAALALVPAPAAGQPAPTTWKQRAEAKRLFNQAWLAYRNGDNEEAIIKWQQSYDLSNEPLIFESIANAYERLGEMDKALENLKKWREAAPAKEHPSLDSRIESLEERVKAAEIERRKRRQKAEAEERERKLREQAEAKRNNDQGAGKLGGARGPSAKAIAGYTLTGVGGALVIAGVALDVVAGLRRPDAATSCAEANGQLLCKDSDRAAIEQTNAMAIAGDVGWIVGGASVITGVVVLLTSLQKTDAGGKPRAAVVLPWLAPTGAGLRAEF